MIRARFIILFLSLAVLSVSLVEPAVAQQAPQGVAALPPALRAAILAGNSAQVAQVIQTLSGGNPQRAAQLASSAIAEAEKLLATNPQAAIAVAGAAVQTVRNAPVQQSAPQDSLNVATIAARIMVQPSVQQVAPDQVANLAAAATSVATSPVVYAASPAAAIQIMANAYAAVTAAPVAAAVPGASATVATTLRQASVVTQLNTVNPTNAASIDQILRGLDPATGRSLAEIGTNTQTTPTVTQNPVTQGSPS